MLQIIKSQDILQIVIKAVPEVKTIQGVSWVVEINVGDYFLRLCDKHSHKHVSDFFTCREVWLLET